MTAASSQEGAFDVSTATDAPFSASASPSPVSVLTPELGDAAIVSCPCSRNLATSFDPMSPLPPITTIFMITSFGVRCNAPRYGPGGFCILHYRNHRIGLAAIPEGDFQKWD